MFRPYVIQNTRWEVVSEHSDQDHALRGLYDIARTRGIHSLDEYSIFYIHEDDHEEFIKWGGDTDILDWINAQMDLAIELRLSTGYDVIGLEEALALTDLAAYYDDSKPETITHVPDRYTAGLFQNGDLLCEAKGSTRPEALARAVILFKEDTP